MIMPAWLRRKQITFCGIAQNVEVATLTFAYFRASISHLARRRKLKPRQMSSYKTGAAERIFVEVSISRRQAIAEGEGIVRVGNAVASRHLQQNYPQRTQKTRMDHEILTICASSQANREGHEQISVFLGLGTACKANNWVGVHGPQRSEMPRACPRKDELRIDRI